ncbi:hypothetical protein N7535_007900 [Penicillium sp. DV-2018c]|nr:hypothetical protein N7461_003934 [Penicillium sp. DV-2018c]KAJ5566262.1 hypothetical protein N7535_007900 [Penicillium sp. DV-2018c]
MYYGMFSCIGSFISTTTDPAGLRLFLLNITYNNARGSPPDQNVASYVNFKVLAAIPNTARWTNFRTPNTGRHLQVTGDSIGYYPFEGKDIFCITVNDISYVSSNSGPTATTAAAAPTISVVHETRPAVNEAHQEEPDPDENIQAEPSTLASAPHRLPLPARRGDRAAGGRKTLYKD